MKKPVVSLVTVLGLLLSHLNALANDSTESFQNPSVGTVVEYVVEPQLSEGLTKTFNQWSRTITQKDAEFIKVHFENFNLTPGDSLQVISKSGRVIETLTEQGYKSKMNFWSLSAPGDSVKLQLNYRHAYHNRPPFKVSRIIKGSVDTVDRVNSDQSATRSICFPPDYLDAACFLDDPEKSIGIEASVGIMYINYQGDGEDILGCSGSSVSANSNIMTNNHCIPNQLTCDNAEVVFKYRRSACDTQSPIVDDWVSYRCDQLLVTSTAVQGAGAAICTAEPGFVDMSLLSIDGDPATQFGFLELNTDPIDSGLNVYQVHHPLIDAMQSPQQVTTGGGEDVVVDGSTLRYNNTMDTFPGSSGSPVISATSNKIVALHNCGFCLDPAVRNAGALASVIEPLIQEYTCGESLKLNFGKVSDLNELVGNNNGSIDPGESWSVTVRGVNNSCDLDAIGVTGEVMLSSSVTEEITIHTDQVQFGDIGARDIEEKTIVFSVPSDSACGSSIAFDFLQLQDLTGNSFDPVAEAVTFSIGAKDSTIVFSERFDTGLGGWTISDGGSNSNGSASWQLLTGGPQFTVFDFPFVEVDSGDHPGQIIDESLISPIIDVSAFSGATLQFEHDFKFNGSNTSQEKGNVQVRSNATGNQWVSVRTYTGSDFSGAEQINMTQFLASNLQVRFRYFDAMDDYHWSIDNVYLVADDGFACEVYDVDTDADGVPDNYDNCIMSANSDQRDTNQDGYGNSCDPDLNNDNITNFIDVAMWQPFFNSVWNGDEDFNGDGVVNFIDYIVLTSYFENQNSGPGPSGIAP